MTSLIFDLLYKFNFYGETVLIFMM
jgi:hypothetical protein